MATGRNGAFGKSALKPVGKATRPEPELAATLLPNMVEGLVMAAPLSQSCATLGRAQVRIQRGC